MRRISMAVVAAAGMAVMNFAGDAVTPGLQKQREKKRRYSSGGKAVTKGKKHRSLKSRSNRQKAKGRV